MKKLTILCASAIMLASCGMMGGSAASGNQQQTANQQQVAAVSADPSTQGQSAGNALKNIYAQYKADGKYDASNINNIINTLTLVNNCQGLKNNAKNSDYWKNFASGLILGSDMLVNTANVNKVTDGLQSMVNSVDTSKLQAAANDANAAATNAMATANSISNILSLFSNNK